MTLPVPSMYEGRPSDGAIRCARECPRGLGRRPQPLLRATRARRPLQRPPLAEALAGVAAPAEDAGPRRQRLATEDERLGVVGRELAGSHRVRWAMPARTCPAMDRDPSLDRPLRQLAPCRGPAHRMVGCPPEAVGEARTTAAALVRRRPATGACVGLAASTGADAGARHPPPSGLDDHGRAAAWQPPHRLTLGRASRSSAPCSRRTATS